MQLKSAKNQKPYNNAVKYVILKSTKYIIFTITTLFSSLLHANENIEKIYFSGGNIKNKPSIIQLRVMNKNIIGKYSFENSHDVHFLNGEINKNKLIIHVDDDLIEVKSNRSDLNGHVFNDNTNQTNLTFHYIKNEELNFSVKESGIDISLRKDKFQHINFDNYEYVDYTITLADLNFDNNWDLIVTEDFGSEGGSTIIFFDPKQGLFNTENSIYINNYSISSKYKVLCGFRKESAKEYSYETVLKNTSTKVLFDEGMGTGHLIFDGMEKPLNRKDFESFKSNFNLQCQAP